MDENLKAITVCVLNFFQIFVLKLFVFIKVTQMQNDLNFYFYFELDNIKSLANI